MLKEIKLLGVGTFLPGNAISNEDMQDKFSVNAEWIELFIGNKSRHLAYDIHTNELQYNLAEMCKIAANNALDCADIDADDIDIVILGTATPDQLMPATVNTVIDLLGINNVPTYQLQSGCTGAMQALDVATQFLKTGRYKTALVMGADICVKFMDFDRDFSELSSSELINYVLFGDGAGAAVLSSSSEAKAPVIVETFVRCEGMDRSSGQELNWLGFSGSEQSTHDQIVKEDYKVIEEKVPTMATEVMTELLDKLDWKRDSINYFMSPQLSGQMTDNIIDKMELPYEKTLNCVTETGNTANALPFLQLEILFHKLTVGQRALGVAIESSKWIKSGIALEYSA